MRTLGIGKLSKMTKQKEELEIEEGIGYNQIPPKDIFAYNELRSCSDLFRLHKEGILDIQPEFQRNEVWTPKLQTLFIDSLLKELPIPSMCISYDKGKNEMRLIDGLQRMASIIKFLDTDNEWKLQDLNEIDPRIRSKTNKQIKNEHGHIFNSIENLSLPVTFLRVNNEDPSHNEYIFEIFHRLNTYGKKLNNQEIRNCIFSGKFNSFIKDLAGSPSWKKLLNFKEDNRFAKAELVLRFFAFYENDKNYDGNLTKFLNDYMSKHRYEQEDVLEKKRIIFERTVDFVISQIMGGESLMRKTSNAYIDALLYGVAKNLPNLNKEEPEKIIKYYRKFNGSNSLKDENLLEGTMRKGKVEERLKTARTTFAGK